MQLAHCIWWNQSYERQQVYPQFSAASLFTNMVTLIPEGFFHAPVKIVD